MIYWPYWRLALALALAAAAGGTACHLLHLIQKELEIQQMALSALNTLLTEIEEGGDEDA